MVPFMMILTLYTQLNYTNVLQFPLLNPFMTLWWMGSLWIKLWQTWCLYFLCHCIWFIVPFQHISGHIRTVSTCKRGYHIHCIVLPHSDITHQAHWYDISPGLIFQQQANQTLCWITLYMPTRQYLKQDLAGNWNWELQSS